MMDDVPPPVRVALFHPDRATAALFRDTLAAGDGFELTVHDHALVGLSALVREPPQIVVAAIEMPIFDGFQLLSLLKSPEYPGLNSIPVLLLGQPSIASSHRAKELGARDFLDWPAKPEVLFYALQRVREGPLEGARLPMVAVMSTNAQVMSAVQAALAGEAELEIVAVADLPELKSLEFSRVLEMIVVDSSDIGKALGIVRYAQQAHSLVPVVVANLGAPNPGEARRYLASGAADVAQAIGRHSQIADACRHHLRRSRSRRSSPHAREDYVQHFFDAATTAIVIASSETTRVLAANDATATLLGRTRHEIERLSLAQLFGPEAHPAFELAMAQARKQGASLFDLSKCTLEGTVGKATLSNLGWSGLLLVTLLPRIGG